MIIKTTRISTVSGHQKVAAHVLTGDKNEEIHLLQGSPDDLADMIADAKTAGKKYGIRHLVISPQEEITREEALRIADEWGEEFGIGERTRVIVEHKKPRANDEGFDRHWHVLHSELDPISGKVLDSKHSFARNEKIARMAEIRLGHSITKGRHNRAVVAALAAEAPQIAARLAESGIDKGKLPNSAFTSDAFQQAQRADRSLSEIRDVVRSAWSMSDDGPSFRAALAEHGLKVEQGRKKAIITDTEGNELGSIDRLAKVKESEVQSRLQTQKSAKPANQANPEGPEMPSTSPLARADIPKHIQNSDESQGGKGGKAGETDDMAPCPDMTDGVADFGSGDEPGQSRGIPQNLIQAANLFRNGGLKNVKLSENIESRTTGATEKESIGRNLQASERSTSKGPFDTGNADRGGERRPTESNRPNDRVVGKVDNEDGQPRTKGRVSKSAVKRIYQAKMNVQLSKRISRLDRLKAWLTSDQLLAYQFELDAEKFEKRATRESNIYSLLEKDEKAQELKREKDKAWGRWFHAKEDFKKIDPTTKPTGWWNAITGRSREWDNSFNFLKSKMERLDKEHDEAVEKYDERIQKNEEVGIENADANAKDLSEALRKRQIADALRNGNKSVLEAIRQGDIQKAGELAKPVEKAKYKPKKQYQQQPSKSEKYEQSSGPKM